MAKKVPLYSVAFLNALYAVSKATPETIKLISETFTEKEILECIKLLENIRTVEAIENYNFKHKC